MDWLDIFKIKDFNEIKINFKFYFIKIGISVKIIRINSIKWEYLKYWWIISFLTN